MEDPARTGEFEPDGSFTRIPSVPERLPTEYGHLEAVVDAAYAAWPQFQAPETLLGRLKLAFFDRAFNVVKGVLILVEQSRWELAAPLVRQLFEMILNLEELERAEDPDSAVVHFARFAALQEMRHRFANFRHDLAMGRDVEANRARLEEGYHC